MNNFFQICRTEYGINDSVPSAIRWARLGDPTPPRKITTEEDYVRECRRLCRRHGLDELGGTDARLILAGFRRVPPREWILGDRRDRREPRLLSDFIAWWIATQERPGVVGSCYNAYPGDAFALWQAGITPKRAKLVPPAHWSRLVRHGKVRRNLRDAAHIGRALRRAWAAPYPMDYDDPDRGDVGTNTLVILGRMEPEYQRIALRGALSRRIERAGYGPVRPQDLDWEGVAATRAQLKAAPVKALRAARCPTRHFLRWSDPTLRGREIRSIIALRERGWRIFVSTCRQYEEQEHPFPLVVELWERILAAGCANHPTLIKHAGDLAYNPGALSAALAAGHVPDPQMSWHQLLEWLDSLGHTAQGVGQDRSVQHHLRALDRLAQRDPDEAIRSYRAEYERGSRLGDLLRQVLACLRTQADEGATLVVHGRDGELIHELCRRSGIPTRYAITSRPLTTQRSSTSASEAEYDRYLRATVPDRAVHVDTGFAGSIPRWLGGRGWTVAKIMMVSAVSRDDQMPIEGISSSSLREIVLADLEHSAQRLECPRSWPPRYSHEAMGFWARVYGACDAIGLPRQMGSRREVAS